METFKARISVMALMILMLLIHLTQDLRRVLGNREEARQSAKLETQSPITSMKWARVTQINYYPENSNSILLLCQMKFQKRLTIVSQK